MSLGCIACESTSASNSYLACHIVLPTACESLYKQVTTPKLLCDNSLVSAR
jgi:hypothetical protein